jgi:ankyrin repeat protein
MVTALIAAGADPNVGNNFGVTPLLQASRIGDVPVMRALLDGGAAMVVDESPFEPVLHAAARAGNVEAVSLLLERGSNPNAVESNQDQTALMWAAAEGHADVLAVLLAAGADPDMQARINSLTERKNADFPSGGFTALMWAARNGHGVIVAQLAAAGAELDIANGDGATATMISIVNDRFDLAAALVELGADVNDGSLYEAVVMRDATTDWYARDGSKLRPDHDNELTALGLIALLLEKGADPNRTSNVQMHSATMCCDTQANGTPFYRAAVAADVDALRLLIDHGSDLAWMPERVEGGGMMGNRNAGRPALIAAMTGGKGVPLSAGPGFSREGQPPFRELANREPAAAIQLLLQAGADVNATLANGTPALHEAVRSRSADSVRIMIEAGAALDAKDSAGLTALHVAEQLPTGDSGNPFGPRREDGGAEPEELASLLREAMEAAGVAIEPAPVKEEASVDGA